MMYKKEYNVNWALEMCRDLLNFKDISPKFVVSYWDNALMNVVDTVFPEASNMLSEYHIGKNVREKCKTNCKVKELNGLDGKDNNSREMVKTIMNAWVGIVNSDTKQVYIDNYNQFKIICNMFHKFLEYVKTTILGLGWE
jgi:hypothetical protein